MRHLAGFVFLGTVTYASSIGALAQQPLLPPAAPHRESTTLIPPTPALTPDGPGILFEPGGHADAAQVSHDMLAAVLSNVLVRNAIRDLTPELNTILAAEGDGALVEFDMYTGLEGHPVLGNDGKAVILGQGKSLKDAARKAMLPSIGPGGPPPRFSLRDSEKSGGVFVQRIGGRLVGTLLTDEALHLVLEKAKEADQTEADRQKAEWEANAKREADEKAREERRQRAQRAAAAEALRIQAIRAQRVGQQTADVQRLNAREREIAEKCRRGELICGSAPGGYTEVGNGGAAPTTPPVPIGSGGGGNTGLGCGAMNCIEMKGMP